MNIYVFGNPLVAEDSFPLRILPRLKELFPRTRFLTVDPNENFPPENEKNLIILDSVKGIRKPTFLNLDDLEEMKKTPVSPHDYDLLMHLLLLKKTKKINEVSIIGVPSFGGDETTKSVEKIIATLLSKSERRKTYKGQKRG